MWGFGSNNPDPCIIHKIQSSASGCLDRDLAYWQIGRVGHIGVAVIKAHLVQFACDL